MAGPLDQLVEKLTKALGEDLISVVLYGSAAAGDHNRKFSDFNILCVLREITPEQLGASETIFRWWREQGNPSPLLLSKLEVNTSTDCFPIEFHDIQKHHRVLYGADVVTGLEIGDSYYRAQVEHELRAKLLRLRQKAAGVLSDKDVLRALLVDSVSTFCVLFRHALMLYGADPSGRKRDVIDQAQARFGIDPAPFRRLLDLREERAKARDLEPGALLGEYMKQIGTVIEAVNALERGV
jgi:predicted nucleotidyltransferase